MTQQVNALTAILVTPDASTELQAATASAKNAAAMAEWPCETPEDEKTLAEFLSAIQDRLRRLEEVRKTIAGPLHQAKKALDSLFSAAAAPYEDAKDRIKAVLERRESERRALQAQAKAAALAAQAAGDSAASQAALAVVVGTAGPVGGVTFRQEWTWELEDISQVPPEFLALNPVSLKAYVHRFRSSDTIEGVPGIRFLRVAKAVAR